MGGKKNKGKKQIIIVDQKHLDSNEAEPDQVDIEESMVS